MDFFFQSVKIKGAIYIFFTARCRNKPAPCTSTVASSEASTEPPLSERGHNETITVLWTMTIDEVQKIAS